MKKIIVLILIINVLSLIKTAYSFQYLQLAFCAYPLLQESLEYFSIDEKMALTYPAANPEITAFIHELLEHHGVKNSHKVVIKLGKEYCSGKNILMIEWLNEKSEISLLESLIVQYNNLANSSEAEALLMLIFQQIGSIEHEISHIKNNDCKKRALSLATFSLLSWAFTKFLEYQLPHSYPSLQKKVNNAGWTSKLTYNLATGFLLALINKHIMYKICRNQERAADAMISDNASILLAKVNLHTTIHETAAQQVEKKYGKLVSWLCKKIPSLYLFFDWSHPTSYERAQTFANRLVKILNRDMHIATVAEI